MLNKSVMKYIMQRITVVFLAHFRSLSSFRKIIILADFTSILKVFTHSVFKVLFIFYVHSYVTTITVHTTAYGQKKVLLSNFSIQQGAHMCTSLTFMC